MLFSYKAKDQDGKYHEGTVDSLNHNTAIRTLTARGLTVQSISAVEKKSSILNKKVKLFDRVAMKDIVIASQQIATLSESQVPALRIFMMLSNQVKESLGDIFRSVANELQGGSSISRALAQHPKVFSPFYVNIVKAGEESGTLSKSFEYLAEYLDRNYAIVSKVRGALIYPAFVIVVFVLVMMLMLTMVIPKITEILIDSGATLPIYTRIVIALSDFLSNYITFITAGAGVLGFLTYQYSQTSAGKRFFDELKLGVPVVGKLYHKLYLTRICDNLSTMISSGIPMLEALKITADVVDNGVYRDIMESVIIDVRGGSSLSAAFSQHELLPQTLVQMSKAGEESGALSDILVTLSVFYRREVQNAVDAIISLIEPAMIVFLGVGVGVLIGSVLIPIYNITTAF